MSLPLQSRDPSDPNQDTTGNRQAPPADPANRDTPGMQRPGGDTPAPTPRQQSPMAEALADAANSVSSVEPAAAAQSDNNRYTIKVPSDETELTLGRSGHQGLDGIIGRTKTAVRFEATGGEHLTTLNLGKAGGCGHPGFDMVTLGRTSLHSAKEFRIHSNEMVVARSLDKVRLEAGNASGFSPSTTEAWLETRANGRIESHANSHFSVTSDESVGFGCGPKDCDLTTWMDINALGYVNIGGTRDVTIKVGDCKIELGPGFIHLSNGAGADIAMIGTTIMMSAPASILVNTPMFLHNGAPVKLGA